MGIRANYSFNVHFDVSIKSDKVKSSDLVQQVIDQLEYIQSQCPYGFVIDLQNNQTEDQSKSNFSLCTNQIEDEDVLSNIVFGVCYKIEKSTGVELDVNYTVETKEMVV